MTRTTNARIAGITYLFYIAVAFPSLTLMTRATSGEGTAAKLARVAEHASDVRVAMLLTLLSCYSAIVLAVTLYGITREVDHELAMLSLACRVSEGALGAIGIPMMRGLLWLATAGGGAGAPDVATANALGAFLLMPAQSAMIGAPFFALGSTVFSYLLLRGRLVPAPCVARPVRLGPGRGGLAPAARRLPRRTDDHLHVAADARVRGSARTVAALQGRRHARDTMMGGYPRDNQVE